MEDARTTAQRPAWRARTGNAALALAVLAWVFVLIGGSDSSCDSSGMSATDILAAAGFFAAPPLAVLGVGLHMRWRLHPWLSSIGLAVTIVVAVIGDLVTLGLVLSGAGCFD